MMNILQAMSDPKTFDKFFAKDERTVEQWRPWRVVLAALFGLPITDPDDLALYKECTGRETRPSNPAEEATLIVGRRGGKSRIRRCPPAARRGRAHWRRPSRSPMRPCPLSPLRPNDGTADRGPPPAGPASRARAARVLTKSHCVLTRSYEV